MEKLTVEIATQRVATIKEVSGDDEVAHGKEDSLRGWFIKCLALGLYDIDEARAVAMIVMSTDEIEFERWCA
jgi:hypothetical protein